MTHSGARAGSRVIQYRQAFVKTSNTSFGSRYENQRARQVAGMIDWLPEWSGSF